jgi:transcriptional regulator with XRE-family HTH domain
MKIHEKIKFMRQIKGWSQGEIAERIGMSPNGYGSIERGDTDISLSRLEKIASVFGIDLIELMSLGNQVTYNKVCEQIGDNNTSTNYQFIGNPEFVQVELRYELEKKDLLLAERDKEILHLKEIIELLKKHQT